MFWKFLIFIGLFKALPTLGLPAEEILQQTHVTRCLDRAQTDPRLMKRMERIEEGAEVVASAKSENNLGKASASVENSAQKDSEVCSTRKSLSRKVKQNIITFVKQEDRERKNQERQKKKKRNYKKHSRLSGNVLMIVTMKSMGMNPHSINS
ncbi:hypothetical protein KEM48_006718 [Puccinia striiformis f. sp. tritici PST-130]|nr:hypothetical protein KEM48_006718 [Puccinia striiformis f. sp. tritici PST-130]